MLEADLYNYAEEGTSNVHQLLEEIDAPLDHTIATLIRSGDLNNYSLSPITSVHTTLPTPNTPEVLFRGSSNDPNDH